MFFLYFRVSLKEQPNGGKNQGGVERFGVGRTEEHRGRIVGEPFDRVDREEFVVEQADGQFEEHHAADREAGHVDEVGGQKVNARIAESKYRIERVA